MVEETPFQNWFVPGRYHSNAASTETLDLATIKKTPSGLTSPIAARKKSILKKSESLVGGRAHGNGNSIYHAQSRSNGRKNDSETENLLGSDQESQTNTPLVQRKNAPSNGENMGFLTGLTGSNFYYKSDLEPQQKEAPLKRRSTRRRPSTRPAPTGPSRNVSPPPPPLSALTGLRGHVTMTSTGTQSSNSDYTSEELLDDDFHRPRTKDIQTSTTTLAFAAAGGAGAGEVDRTPGSASADATVANAAAQAKFERGRDPTCVNRDNATAGGRPAVRDDSGVGFESLNTATAPTGPRCTNASCQIQRPSRASSTSAKTVCICGQSMVTASISPPDESGGAEGGGKRSSSSGSRGRSGKSKGFRAPDGRANPSEEAKLLSRQSSEEASPS